MNKEEIQKKADQIEKIYQDYQVKLNQLKSKQNNVIKGFIEKLEKEKLEKLRNLLK
ncbi:MAG: hypothetical protein Q8P20_04595 [bacterium]|nr:hypothetical protein [bacterium]